MVAVGVRDWALKLEGTRNPKCCSTNACGTNSNKQVTNLVAVRTTSDAQLLCSIYGKARILLSTAGREATPDGMPTGAKVAMLIKLVYLQSPVRHRYVLTSEMHQSYLITGIFSTVLVVIISNIRPTTCPSASACLAAHT